MNMIGVRYFGEMEFWFSLIKVVALAAFLIAGTLILGSRMPVAGHTTGLHLITENGGLFRMESCQSFCCCKVWCLPIPPLN